MGSNLRPPERAHTDDSLRSERERADEGLEDARQRAVTTSDEVLARAQRRADEKLALARSNAEAKLKRAHASDEEFAAERAEHVCEDATLAGERTIAAAALENEREQGRLALAKLLRIERAQTDAYLLVERARSDDAVLKRDDFLGMVSHDLRSMLSGIALSAQRLNAISERPDAKAKTRDIADYIERVSTRMNRLVEDLMDVTRIESGRLVLMRQRHDLAELLLLAKETFEPLVEGRGLALKASISSSTLFASFDRERVLQVLGNLVGNAIKFTPPGGEIVMSAQTDGDFVRVCVSDTGTGIAADKREAIFERFWQATSTSRQGLGLGLYICRRLVEAHGGRIWVGDSSERGSTLCFTLPAAAS